MEPQNRPYVDPGTEPGDAGTEEWADEKAQSGTSDRGTLSDGSGERDAEGALIGSPADAFDDGDAFENREKDTP